MEKRKRYLRLTALCLAGTLCLTACGQRPGKLRRPYGSSEQATETTASAPTETQTAPAEANISVSDQMETAPKEPLVYGDSRVPSYSSTTPDWQTIDFEWSCQGRATTGKVSVTLDANMYQYYRNLPRYYQSSEYYNYVNDENNRQVVQSIVNAMREIGTELNYDDGDIAREIANFVQQCVEYQLDSETTGQEDYPRYPIETIYERQGDCEDSSILLAALLKEYGYEVGFLRYPTHVAVVIRTLDDYSGGAYFQYEGHRYLYIESTATGWSIGAIPEDYQTSTGELYLIP